MLQRLAPITVVVAAALLGLAPGGAHAQTYPAVPVQAEGLRNPWYIGFGIGSGAGNLTVDGQTRSFRDFLGDTPVTLALQFEVGATLRQDLLLGFDLRTIRSQISHDEALQATDWLAMITWYPMERGLFLRGGVGLATLTWDFVDVYGRGTDTVSGVGALGGLGYAFWLGRSFNLTLNADVSAQLFAEEVGRPSSSRFLDVYVGFGWY